MGIINYAGAVHEAVKRVCPILNVSIGKPNDKTTWRINLAPEATDKQKRDAADVIESFDVAKVLPTVDPRDVVIAQLQRRLEALENRR
jgi:hypothetical protein